MWSDGTDQEELNRELISDRVLEVRNLRDEISLLKQSFRFINNNINNIDELTRFLTFRRASEEAKDLVHSIIKTKN